jgi:hypothetical protein
MVVLEEVALILLTQPAVLAIRQINHQQEVMVPLLFLIRGLMGGITHQEPMLVVAVAEVLEVLDLMVRQLLAEMVGQGRHQQLLVLL